MLEWSQVREWNDFLWYWYSNIVMLVPMTFLFFYKLLHPINWDHLHKDKKELKPDFGDKFLTIISSYSLFYYVVDCIVKIATGSYTTGCDFSMFLHHIVSLIVLPTVIFANYWPWFWLGPGAMHTYLIAFPDAKWLNYIYLLIIFLFQFGLYQKPFTNLKEYSRMKWGIVTIELACVVIWWFDCTNHLVGIN